MAAVEADRLQRVLTDLAGPLVADHGGELVDIEISGSDSFLVRLLVYCQGGVTVKLCEDISRELADVLDVEDPVPGRYRLEVTSPGLDRPLQADDDFRRAEQRRLKVVTNDGRTEYGRLVGFTAATIELDKDDGCRLAVARSDIAKATIEVEF